MIKSRHLTIRVVTPIALLMAALTVAGISGYAWFSLRETRAALTARAQQTVAVLAGGLSETVWQWDDIAAGAQLAALAIDPDYAGSTIWDHRGKPFASHGRERVDEARLIIQRSAIHHSLNGERLNIGTVELRIDPGRAESDLARRLAHTALAGLGYLLAVCGALVLIVRGVIRPINQLTRTMTDLAGGDTAIEVPALERGDEIGRMAAATQVFRDNAIALRQSEARYRDLLENLIEGVYQTSPDGRLLAANQAYAEMLGYPSPAEAIAAITDLARQVYVDPGDRARLLATLEAAGGIQGFETRFRRRDGSVVVVLASARAVRDRDRIVRIEGTVADITARRQAEDQLRALNIQLEDRVRQRTHALEQALESLQQAQDELVRSEKLAGLGALVAGIAHEVNTPIGSAVTVATTLQGKAAAFRAAVEEGGLRRSVLNGFLADLTEASRLMLASLEQAATLIANFKQVAVDQTSERRRSFDLALVTDEVLSTLRPMVKHRAIRIETAIADGIVLDSYPGAFGQVLTNLITNAFIHGFEGQESGCLRIGADRPEAGRERPVVVVRISDDGRGMPAQILPRIFDPFFTTRLGKGGSGLGLHLVYTMVTRILGGRIEVASQPGQGTSFTLTLPVTAPG